MRKILLGITLAIACNWQYTPGKALMLSGYVSNDYDPPGFLAEINESYPCWYWLCAETVRWRSDKLRHKYWFNSTFFGEMDRATVKHLESIALKYGLLL